MKISICSVLSRNGDFEYNYNEIRKCIEKASSDLILFGEAVLNGFDGISFNYEEDIFRVYSMNSVEVTKIRELAVKNNIAIGFGFYENEKGGIYSTYVVFDKDGEIILKYQRKSKGWKSEDACSDYREGNKLKAFNFMGNKIGVMICGDFWEDNLLDEIVDMDYYVDFFIWPVHIDYSDLEWEDLVVDYRRRTEILEKTVFLIDNAHENIEKNRLYVLRQGKVLSETIKDENILNYTI